MPNPSELARADEAVVRLDLPDEPFLLEIAAGERPTPGYIHNDARDLPGIEIVADARDELLALVGEQRCREVRATHVLEHFPYGETVNVLKLWRSLLVPGGRLYLEVPDMGWQIDALYEGSISPDEFVYYAYGEQNYPGNFHCAGFTITTLGDRLEEAGYETVDVSSIGQVLIAHATKSS